MKLPMRSCNSKKLQKETNNKYPNSPKPKSKTKSKARKNPLRQGVVYNSLSDLLKNFAVKKRNTPELFKNTKNRVKK